MFFSSLTIFNRRKGGKTIQTPPPLFYPQTPIIIIFHTASIVTKRSKLLKCCLKLRYLYPIIFVILNKLLGLFQIIKHY